jgi:hypothetical protein
MGDSGDTHAPQADLRDARTRTLHCPECLKGFGTPVSIARGNKLVVITAVCENCAGRADLRHRLLRVARSRAGVWIAYAVDGATR